MLKKQISYEDYNGNQRTEDFYFNVSRGELAEMELSTSGGLEQYYKRIIDAQNSKALTQVFKDLILKSYGVKSLDGKRFEKSEELSKEFEQSEAYSELFVELLSDTEKAKAFILGITPTIPEDHRS